MAKRTQPDRLLPPNAKALAKAVKAARGGSTVVEYRIKDVRGLVLHVLPSGTATWYFHYDVGAGRSRKRRKLKLGRYDDLSLSRAVDEVDRLRTQIQDGTDPAKLKVEVREAWTFGDLVSHRLEHGDTLREGTQRDYQDLLRADILPVLGDKSVKSITREDILAVLDRISARGSTRRADTARAVISSVFSFGMDRGLVSSNPASGIRNRHKNLPRDTIASDEDIRTLWNALDAGTAVMSPEIRLITKLALLTAQRRTEIAAVKKSQLELSGTAPVLTVTRGQAKNNTAHRVPLSPQAVALFQEALKLSKDAEFVFPGRTPGTHIAPRSVSQAMQRTREKLGISDITVHDLRRTAGTCLSRFGVPKDVRERVLNHGGKRKGSVTDGVYNVYDYDSEKRAALELWADALDCIVEGHGAEIDSYNVRLARRNGGAKIRIN